MTRLWIVPCLALAVVVLLVFVLGAPGGPSEVRDIRALNGEQGIIVDFGAARVAVQGWDKAFVRVQANGSSTDGPIDLVVSDNRITCQTVIRPQPYWEPAYRVYVPRRKSLIAIAGELWVERCALQSTSAKYTNLKECSLDPGYEAEGDHINVTDCHAFGIALWRKKGSSRDYPMSFRPSDHLDWSR